MADSCCQVTIDVSALQARQRRVLNIVLAVNAATFIIMIAASVHSGSSSLLSGALDNLGDALTYALRSSNPPAWLLVERDQAIAVAVRRVFDDDGSSALFALFSVERSLPVLSDQKASLSTLAVLAACAQADPADPPLDESYRRLLADAEVHFRDAPATLHQRHLLAAAWEQLAVHHAAHFRRLVAKMQRSSENIVEQASRHGRRRNGQLAELAMEPILHDAAIVGESIADFRAHVTSTPVAAELDAMSAALDDVRGRAEQLRRGRFE